MKYEINWYYWVIILDTGFWQPALFDGHLWYVPGDECGYSTNDLGQVGEKIPSNYYLQDQKRISERIKNEFKAQP